MPISVALVEAILAGIGQAPALIASAQTLINMFSKGSITEAELTTIWTSTVAAVESASSGWKAAKAPTAAPMLP